MLENNYSRITHSNSLLAWNVETVENSPHKMRAVCQSLVTLDFHWAELSSLTSCSLSPVSLGVWASKPTPNPQAKSAVSCGSLGSQPASQPASPTPTPCQEQNWSSGHSFQQGTPRASSDHLLHAELLPCTASLQRRKKKHRGEIDMSTR